MRKSSTKVSASLMSRREFTGFVCHEGKTLRIPFGTDEVSGVTYSFGSDRDRYFANLKGFRQLEISKSDYEFLDDRKEWLHE